MRQTEHVFEGAALYCEFTQVRGDLLPLFNAHQLENYHYDMTKSNRGEAEEEPVWINRKSLLELLKISQLCLENLLLDNCSQSALPRSLRIVPSPGSRKSCPDFETQSFAKHHFGICDLWVASTSHFSDEALSPFLAGQHSWMNQSYQEFRNCPRTLSQVSQLCQQLSDVSTNAKALSKNIRTINCSYLMPCVRANIERVNKVVSNSVVQLKFLHV